MARAGKIALNIVLILLLMVAGYEAQTFAKIGWNSVVEYPSPYWASLPRGSAAPPLAQRVVLVLVDGLRLDASQTMPNLNDLRRRGADLAVRVGQPSLSYPSWTSIATGAWQEVSGVTTNWFEGPVRLDNIFRAAKDAGIPAVVVGARGWQKLFGPDITDFFPVAWPGEGKASPEEWMKADREACQKGLGTLQKFDTGLILLYIGGTDEMAHEYGGTSKEYLQQVQLADWCIGQVASRLDWGRDVLIVAADHGHIDTGGHGGWEEVVLRVPLVVVGHGVRRGAYTDRLQADLAPTVAALLGLPIPTHAQGRPLLEILDAPVDVKGPIGLNAALQLSGFYDLYAQVLGVRPFAGNLLKVHREAIARGEEGALAKFWEQLTRQATAAKRARWWRERLLRFPIALGIALVPLAYYLTFRRRWNQLLLPVGAALLYFVLYNLLFFVARGHTWSLSVFNSEAQIEAFFNQRLLDAALSVAVAGLLLALALWKRSPLETLERMVAFSFTAFYLLLLQVDLFYWLYHIRFLWALPDLRLGFKYYMDLLQMIPVGVLSGVLAGLAVLIGWGIRRWRRPRPVLERVSPAPEPVSASPSPEGEAAQEQA
ncbi:MAG: alkaline phosphatase family protein [Anaerolineae bacterium]|nr:alkaline phosphatase family protein [Anaerolineae bacterium]